MTDEEVARALEQLPGWTGDARRLSRTLEVPADRQQTMLDAIREVQRELDHHAVIAEEPGRLTLTLWTHTRDEVTRRDLELAGRINEIAARF
ncbi:MAG: putative pterin-4-alpha-carbinolamine dehydratase [Frankiales bacterium]|jgi:4a-hydroxytetrahydrobiopterin dehydratase|nr:putative pterin-4-alpha-carbinolamine dehydratase [Frankiales bacterium]